jgi:hypothetical protein
MTPSGQVSSWVGGADGIRTHDLDGANGEIPEENQALARH